MKNIFNGISSLKISSDKLTGILFYISILIFILSFSFTDTPPPGNWTLQYLPASVGNAVIKDMLFLDSATGFIVTNVSGSNSYVLKTTNSGYNWNIIFTDVNHFAKIQFLDNNTGYTAAYRKLYKTTNQGVDWTTTNLVGDLFVEDFFVLNQDTMFIVQGISLTGGLFRTTNGGQTWTRIYYAPPNNPERIYFYNKYLGFYCKGVEMYRTTNGGFNWTLMSYSLGYQDIHFVDSMNGYWSSGMFKTTNSGINWTLYPLPYDPNLDNYIKEFTALNLDTLYGAGGEYHYPTTIRGVIYKSTNAGINWTYHIPDTGYIGIPRYYSFQFINNKTGWAYGVFQAGIHTTNGGDTNWIVSVKGNEISVPDNFILFQNYPNPFNPETNIKYILKEKGHVRIIVYNIEGKEVTELLNKEQLQGEYKLRVSGRDLASGVYFYSMFAGDRLVDTKKLIIIK